MFNFWLLKSTYFIIFNYDHVWRGMICVRACRCPWWADITLAAQLQVFVNLPRSYRAFQEHCVLLTSEPSPSPIFGLL